MSTPEEAAVIGQANALAENNLSWVSIKHSKNGVSWEIKIKHENPVEALTTAIVIDNNLMKKYGAQKE